MQIHSADAQPQPLKSDYTPWTSPNALTIVRRPTVQAKTGFCRSTIYARIKAGLMPKTISLGGRAVGWPLAEIEAVNAARIAGKSDEEIRLLVRVLEAQRVTFAPGPEAA